MSIDLGKLQLYLGPQSLGGADDLEAVILDFIDRARDELLIAVQELESEPVARAIVAARQRKVVVKTILERDYLTVEKALPDPFLPGGGNEANRELHNALLRARIEVITDLNPEIFHQKFIVRDRQNSTRSALLTGSTNFTPTDTGTASANNLNHVVVIGGRDITRIYAAEFEELWTGTFGVMQERHGPRPEEFKVSGVRVKPLFAPDHAPEMEVMKQMLKAKKRIDFAMFTFANSSGIDDTMIALQKSGIPVRGALDRGQGNRDWAATAGLRNAGCDVRLLKDQVPGLRKLHHKLAVIDDQLIIVGSFNYTAPATTFNDENLVVIGDLEEKNTESRAAQRRLGRFVRKEIDRIIDEFGEAV
jgi:phosphatidylserine/phosphatidylglycerophosphate/cardiolipin synthase-like enzyme